MKNILFFVFKFYYFIFIVILMGVCTAAPIFVAPSICGEAYVLPCKSLLTCQLIDQKHQQVFELVQQKIGCNRSVRLVGLNIRLPQVVHFDIKQNLLYVDQVRFFKMLPSEKIRLFIAAANLILNNLSNQDFVSQYYKMAETIECPVCLQQWRNQVHYCADRADICKKNYCLNSLEKFLQLTKKDAYNNYCSAHTDMPLSCAGLEVVATWTGAKGAIQKFEKCLDRQLQDYIPSGLHNIKKENVDASTYKNHDSFVFN